ncbi:MAG: sodium:solute symporter family protein [Planctomycetes bacterium]|nr:sodium:solute symporter family protein [Planctomycetota bacterium]MBT4028750.1 sodium:solute symporter family protein [Planctomycetota bacterium]MBT4560194.1 sodium:solute symporter family protein [Planctomycetota bacterium]MBT5102083.1 sodium:solute symporter family protein [Planctomycetota bacterium]MBT5120656.1 sodium:solute symporter family protein [Planctomycetota bacterium]
MDAASAAGESWVFWAIVIGYFIIVLGFGSWFARFNKSTSDFFFGGRRFSWWLITMSIVATGVGSHSFLKYSSKAFEHGVSGTMAYLNDWFFMPLFMFGWLPIIYYLRVRSIPEYFERRFNRTVRVLATIALLLFMLGYIGIGFVTMAKTLQPILAGVLGWDLITIIWVVAAVAGVYITFGGQTAVIFTDLLQGFILLLAGVALFFLGLNWFGGFDALWQILPPDFKLPLAHFNDDPSFNFVGIFWQDAIAGSIGFLFMNQGLIMRFMACKSVNDGRKAAAFNVLFLLPISAIAVACAGWIGRGMVIQGDLPADIAADDIFVRVTALLTTPAGFGFFVAAVTAALMSTVDTLINAVAAVVINDIYRPILEARKEVRADGHYLKVAMIVSALATIVGVGSAWGFSKFDSLYEAHGFFHATLTPPLVTAIFLGIFWRRFNSRGAVSVFIAGAGLMVLGRFFPGTLISPFSHGIEAVGNTPYKYIGALYNIVVCFGAGVVGTLWPYGKDVVSKALDPSNTAESRGLTLWTLGKARHNFKGGEPNDAPGETVTALWQIDDQLAEGTVCMDAAALSAMAANPGDLVYVCDRRWWLGGLRSAHARFESPEGATAGVVFIAPDIAEAAHFQEGREVTVEKEF